MMTASSPLASQGHAQPAQGALVDQLVHWFLASLELSATVFHVGQYCGRWTASTAGRSRASYHLVLHGRCFVHIEGQAPFRLGPGDGVFFLSDIPHVVSSASQLAPASAAAASSPMQPLTGPVADGAGLACGFFHFNETFSQLLLRSFPQFIVIRSGTPGLGATRALFELILAETDRPIDAPSPLVARLVDALMFYVFRHVAQENYHAAGVWRLVQRSDFAKLLEAILNAPERDWSTQAMARSVHMSRASFFKQFTEISGVPPAQFVVLLRMRIAAQRLQAGTTIVDTAESVGYHSVSAFCRAFKRVHGSLPGAQRHLKRSVT